jgi:thiamine-phosphate pyrophosphorylase
MDPTLYVVLDRSVARERDLDEILAAAIDGGCRMVQLREKEWPSGRLLPFAERLQARCRAAGVTFIINDRVDLALAVGADGVHLGQDDLPAREARGLAPGLLLGVSTHGVDQARRAQADGADYVALGSIYPTGSKAGFELVGLEALRRIRSLVRAPLVAIGGITVERVPDVRAAGADAIAVISAVGLARDPGAATAAFLAALRRPAA